jgi:hypothetical protein
MVKHFAPQYARLGRKSNGGEVRRIIVKYLKHLALTAVVVFSSYSALGDVALTDKASTLRALTLDAPTPLTPAERQALRDANAAKRLAKQKKHGNHTAVTLDAPTPATRLTPAQKQLLRDANAAKRLAKKNHVHRAPATTLAFHAPGAMATGSVSLIDSSGLKYFINTNITFSTSSSASGAASEASYTVPVMASTSAGGLVTSTLSDMFDGYEGICVSLTGRGRRDRARHSDVHQSPIHTAGADDRRVVRETQGVRPDERRLHSVAGHFHEYDRRSDHLHDGNVEQPRL